MVGGTNKKHMVKHELDVSEGLQVRVQAVPAHCSPYSNSWTEAGTPVIPASDRGQNGEQCCCNRGHPLQCCRSVLY